MKKPFVSVIVPVYNVEKYISACVRSLIDQTYPNFEVILVDDGSTDGCPAICDDFAAKYDNISVIHQENRGLAGARNTGIRAACGDYIGFVDADDLIGPQMYEKLYSTAETLSCELVTCGCRSFADDGRQGRHTVPAFPLCTRSVNSRRRCLIRSVSSAGTAGSKLRICTSTCAGIIGIESIGSEL